MANIVLATNPSTLPITASPGMLAVFGSAVGYVPSINQAALRGDILWSTSSLSTPTSVLPGILQYSFVIPSAEPTPFTFGEIQFVSEDKTKVYATGVLDVHLGRSTEENVEVLIYIDMRGARAIAFGNVYNTKTMPPIPFYSGVHLLPPAKMSQQVVAVVRDPVTQESSLVAMISYVNPDIPDDFTSWSLTNYSQIGFGVTGSVLGSQVSLPVVAPLLAATPGQFVMQTENFTVACQTLTPTPDLQNVLVQLSNYQITLCPEGTPFKLYQASNLTSGAAAYVNQLTVTPAKLNALGLVDPTNIVLTDGTVPMKSHLDFGGFGGVNLKDPTEPQDVASLKSVTELTGTAELSSQGTLNQLAALYATVESMQASVNQLMAWMLAAQSDQWDGVKKPPVLGTLMPVTVNAGATTLVKPPFPESEGTGKWAVADGNSNIFTSEYTDNSLTVKGVAEGKSNLIFIQEEDDTYGSAVLTVPVTVLSAIDITLIPTWVVYRNMSNNVSSVRTGDSITLTYQTGATILFMVKNGVPRGAVERVYEDDTVNMVLDDNGEFSQATVQTLVPGTYVNQLYFYDEDKNPGSKSTILTVTHTVTAVPVVIYNEVATVSPSTIVGGTPQTYTISGGKPNTTFTYIQFDGSTSPVRTLDATGSYTETSVAYLVGAPLGVQNTTISFAGTGNTRMVATTIVAGVANIPTTFKKKNLGTNVEQVLTNGSTWTQPVGANIQNTFAGGMPNGKFTFQVAGYPEVNLSLDANGAYQASSIENEVPAGTYQVTSYFYDSAKSAGSKSPPFIFTWVITAAVVTFNEIVTAPASIASATGALLTVTGGKPNSTWTFVWGPTGGTMQTINGSLDANGSYTNQTAFINVSPAGNYTYTFNFAGSGNTRTKTVTVTAAAVIPLPPVYIHNPKVGSTVLVNPGVPFSYESGTLMELRYEVTSAIGQMRVKVDGTASDYQVDMVGGRTELVADRLSTLVLKACSVGQHTLQVIFYPMTGTTPIGSLNTTFNVTLPVVATAPAGAPSAFFIINNNTFHTITQINNLSSTGGPITIRKSDLVFYRLDNVEAYPNHRVEFQFNGPLGNTSTPGGPANSWNSTIDADGYVVHEVQYGPGWITGTYQVVIQLKSPGVIGLVASSITFNMTITN